VKSSEYYASTPVLSLLPFMTSKLSVRNGTAVKLQVFRMVVASIMLALYDLILLFLFAIFAMKPLKMQFALLVIGTSADFASRDISSVRKS
jgi:hypothetical protein